MDDHADNRRWPANPGPDAHAVWAEVGRLVLEGSYADLERLLTTLEDARRQAGDVIAATILSALAQLCLACGQLREEQALHQAALRRAAGLEDDTRRRMLDLLERMAALEPARHSPTGGGAAPDTPAGSRTGPRRGLRDRLASLLHPTASGPTPAAPAGSPHHAASDVAPFAVASIAAADPIIEPAADAAGEGLPDLRVYCLGAFRVTQRDRLLDEWTGQKSRSVFKYLLAHREGVVHAEQLLDHFWRDSPAEAARRSLHQTVYLVRQTLRPAHASQPIIIQVNGGYRLNPDLDVWVDSEAFMAHYRDGLDAAEHGDDPRMVAALQAAQALYTGDFMAEDPYEDWPVAHREQLRNAYLDTLDRLSRHFWAARDDELGLVYCRKLLDVDACREDVHRRLMRVFARRGERNLALRQYHRCVEALRAELDVEPLPATTRLYEKLLNTGSLL